MTTPGVTDIWAASAAGIASLCLGLRANMLKPQFASWKSAPTLVWVSLWALSLICGGAAWSLLNGSLMKAGAREALVYSALAASSIVFLVNLALQRHKHDGDAAGEELEERPPVTAPAGIVRGAWPDPAGLQRGAGGDQ